LCLLGVYTYLNVRTHFLFQNIVLRVQHTSDSAILDKN